MKIVIKPSPNFGGVIDALASDKSISHRVAMFSLLSDQPSEVENYLLAEDTLSSLSIVEQLGAKIERNGSSVKITPPDQIREPADVLNCNNAGTAMRIFVGLLATQKGLFVLTGDRYLNSRPMKRVIDPLVSIGASIDARSGNFAPIVIRGSELKAFDYSSEVASAQVKSAMILAGLFADSTSYFAEPELSRDHTERMLIGMGADIDISGERIAINPLKSPLNPLKFTVPNDPSSGFFFAVAAAIVPNASVLIRGVSLNKTRIEAYKVLQKMGAKVEFIEKESIYESIGDIKITHDKLNAVEVSENISWLIDEIPALAMAFAVADGVSVVRNAKELRVKETDRITATVENLKKCGVDAKELDDGLEVRGGSLIRGSTVDSYGDHRIAMSLAVLGLISDKEMNIEDAECINASFPNFVEILSSLNTDAKVEK